MILYEKCPVCDNTVRAPFEEWDICPQCGTEFGYNDSRKSHEELRREWVAGGRKWWSNSVKPAGRSVF